MQLVIKYLSFILFLTIFSCGDRETINKQETPALNQAVYFEVSYINHAWGKQHNGFFIGPNGAIRTYKNPATWYYLNNEKGKIAETDLQSNLDKTTLSSMEIMTKELNTYTAKISQIKNTQPTQRVPGGNDMGQTSFYAYQYDSLTASYTTILLRQTGDWQSSNEDKRAVEIANWLGSIWEKLP